MTIFQQYLSIYYVFICKLQKIIEDPDILSTENLSISLMSPSQFTNMLNQVKADLEKTNMHCGLLFPDLYYFYDMILVSFRYDSVFSLLLQFPVSI